MSKLVIIEGLDGSGKATQTKLAATWLAQQGLSVRQLSFPNYDSLTSSLVKMYLNKELGELTDSTAYGVSMFYAVDRYGSYLADWSKDYLAKDILLSDRYTTSNLIYQTAKLPVSEWIEFIHWVQDTEYGKMGLPAPDKVIYLDMDPVISQRLMTERYGHDESKKDLHESNFMYLKQCREAALFVSVHCNWRVIRCFDKGIPLAIETIAAMIASEL